MTWCSTALSHLMPLQGVGVLLIIICLFNWVIDNWTENVYKLIFFMLLLFCICDFVVVATTKLHSNNNKHNNNNKISLFIIEHKMYVYLSFCSCCCFSCVMLFLLQQQNYTVNNNNNKHNDKNIKKMILQKCPNQFAITCIDWITVLILLHYNVWLTFPTVEQQVTKILTHNTLELSSALGHQMPLLGGTSHCIWHSPTG